MVDRNELLKRYREAADTAVAELRRHPKVVGIAVCGSLVTGDVWERSDVDILAVMRSPEADWHVVTAWHGDIRVHLQIVSERLLAGEGGSFRGSVLTQLLALSRHDYDPESILQRRAAELTAYPREAQVQETIRHLISFLSEYDRARKCVDTEHTEDAFLHTNLAFRELALAEYARRGRYPQRLLMEDLLQISPNVYRAYVFFVHGRGRVRDRVHRGFGFFERAIGSTLAELGPPLAAALRSCVRPMTSEDVGQVPTVYDRSADLSLLLERLVKQDLVREDRRALNLEGTTLAALSETLFDLY